MSAEPSPHDAAILESIQEAAEQYARAKRSRVRMIRAGRDAGIPWDQITTRLGITRAAAIGLLQRANR